MDHSNSRTLIVGCGFVGEQLALELARARGAVWGLSRSARALPHGVNSISADITVPQTLKGQLPSGVTHLVFAASAGGSSDERYRSVYVTGTRNLLEHLDCGSLERVFFVSSTAVYAQSDGERVDENSATSPTHFSGQRMLEAENLVTSFEAPSVILRCAGIYGPGRTRLIDTVRQGQACYDPSVSRFTNRIHRDDVAGALMHLMQLANPAPLYVGVDEYPAPEREVFEFLAECLNVEGPKTGASGESTRGGNNKQCSSALLRAHGYRFRFPTFRQGYGAMLRA